MVSPTKQALHQVRNVVQSRSAGTGTSAAPHKKSEHSRWGKGVYPVITFGRRAETIELRTLAEPKGASGTFL